MRLFRLFFLAFLVSYSAVVGTGGSLADDKRIIKNEDADYFGGDFQTLKKIPISQCESACLKDARCKAFTYNTRYKWCFLKEEVGELKSAKGAIAGRVVANEVAEKPAEPEIGPAPALKMVRKGLVDSAIAYQTRIKNLVVPPENKDERATVLSADARDALARRDFRAALQNYRVTASYQPEQSEHWAGIAISALGIKPQNNSNERYQLPQEATSAAIVAYRLSKTAPVRANALALLARALERRQQFRPALQAFKASLEVQDSPQISALYANLRKRKGFRVTGHTVDSESRSPRACLNLSEPLSKKQDDYSGFVTVNGEAPQTIDAEGSQICVGGLVHGDRYRITLRSGLPSSVDEVLESPVVVTAYVRDRSATARFSGEKFVLPRVGAKGIPLVSVNASEAALELYKVDERTVSRLLSGRRFLRQLDKWEIEQVRDNLGEKIWSGKVEIDTILNKEVVTAIPVDTMMPERSPGVYMLVAKPKEDKSKSWEQRATQWFVVSDIGLSTYSGTDGLNVFARSLASAKPLEGVSLQLLARNNKLLGTGSTDADGRFRFEPGLMRGTGAVAPSAVLARIGAEDFVLLDLSSSAFDLSDRGVTGRPTPKPLDAFMYTERGIYRAGETVHVGALLRDTSANASTGLPLTFIFERPDGVEYRRIVSQDRGLGGYHAELSLGSNAMRGTWRVVAHADPKGEALVERKFLVEDFVPDRIEFDLASNQPSLSSTAVNKLTLDGRYLYGAPAQGLRLEGELKISTTRSLKGFEGYRFGLADEDVNTVRTTLESLPATDDQGKAIIDIEPQSLPSTTRPLRASVVVRMREASGRSVERVMNMPLSADRTLIGIKPQFEGDQVPEGGTAGFDVIAVSSEGKQIDLAGASWSLVKLERRYQWYRNDGSWNYEAINTTRSIASGRVDLSAEKAVSIGQPVQWGRYRLEIESDDPNGPASSVEFTGGWYVAASTTETPDGLELALDRNSYKPGETARVTITSRSAGEALIVVGAESLLETKTVSVAQGDTVIELPVSANWGAGAYVTATVFRAGSEAGDTRLPERAIGLKWLKVDPGERQLTVKLDVPEKVRPHSTLNVPVQLENLPAGAEGYVMLAAVDVGILNLTRYKAPEPGKWYFGQRQLGLQFRDVYGKLIDASQGAIGKVRSGGDAGGLGSQGSAPTQPLVALFSGVVQVGPDGKASIPFDIGQFNGTVRLMAVAWSSNGVGSASQDVIVRDPVVITATVPRFLAPGDKAFMRLDVANTDGAAGDYQLSVTSTGEMSINAGDVPATVTLAEKQQLSLAVPITAIEPGVGSITVRLSALTGPAMEQVLTLAIREPQLPQTRQKVIPLAKAGGSLVISNDILSGYRLAGAKVSYSITRAAGLDIPSLLMELDRYPYGCAEQTTSRALPLLYLSEVAEASSFGKQASIRARIQKAIDRVLAYQSSSGSFGLWQPGTGDLWLDSYVTDFLTRAREEGYLVSDVAFRQALDNLESSLSYDNNIKDQAAEIAYAYYVLARNRRASIGDLRYYADTRLNEFTTALSKAHIGAALGLYGETERAKKVFRTASAQITETQPGQVNRSDYGSTLRDGAAVLALAAETQPVPIQLASLVTEVSRVKQSRRYTSTQENAWMLLAARALLKQDAKLAISVNGAPQSGVINASVDGSELASAPVTVENRSDEDLFAVVTANAVPAEPLPAVTNGFVLSRSYYTLEGKPVDVKTVAQNERFVVVLKITEQNAWVSRVLVSDLLPAGFEIDNPKIISSADLNAFSWLPTNNQAAHTEFRDDRFVAAFNRTARDSREFSLAYIVRAVTPGTYVHPAAHVEDMYRPQLHSRTNMGAMEVVGPKP